MAMKLYEENDVQNIANAIRAKQTPPLISKWLEYIEPAGEEPYFNTGYIPTDTTGIKLEVKYNETINDRVSVGVRENQGNTRFFIAVSGGYGYWGWNSFTSTNPGYGPAIDTTSKHIISMNYLNNRKHICDNTEYFPITATLSKITRPIFIFRFNRSGNPGNYADMKLYSLEITEGNSVVKKFVPVLDTNNIPCLYEEISKVLYYNAGGGSFNYKEKETQRYTVSQMASAIYSIGNTRDWSEIGYTSEPAFIPAGIDYAKQIQQNWVTSTDYTERFNNDLNLIFMPMVDTSSGINFTSMFKSCEYLKSIPELNTISGENFSEMFRMCISLQNIPQLNTSNGTDFYRMFYGCYILTEIPLLDASKGVIFSGMFSGNGALIEMGGLKNAGQAFDILQSSNYSDYTINLSESEYLTEQSLINVLTNLYDIATKGCNSQKCIIGATNLAKLTSAAGQAALTQAQNYGWTIS